MKRKVKKYADGDLVEKEGKGFFGETQKWKEDKEGRKFTDSGNRYYSADDVKGKLSGLFGGKKEEDEPKKSTTMPSGYEKLDVSEKTTPSGKTYVNQEYKEEEEKPAKKAAPATRKAAPAPKASMDAGIPKDTKSTRMPSGYEKLDVSEKKSMGKDATPMKKDAPVGRTRAGTVVKSSNEPKAEDVAAANEKFVAKMKKQGEENEARRERIKSFFSTKSPNRSYKSGGSVKSSASSRGDGIAMRGKTKGKIY
jgi:hypothetical protein